MSSLKKRLFTYYIPGTKKDFYIALFATFLVSYFHLRSHVSFHHIIHFLHYYLFYLIIIYSAHKFGLLGGIFSAFLLSLIYNPKSYLILLGVKDLDLLRPFLEIVMMYTIGIFSGLFSQRLYLEKEKLRQLTEELRNSLILLEKSIDEKISLEKEMARVDRLRVLGQLTAGIAHEIRNPLAAIRSGVNLIKSGNRDERILNVVTSEIDRLNNFVERFLQYARIEKGKEIKIKVKEFFEEILELVNLTCKNKKNVLIKSTSSLNEDMYLVGDKDSLKQALINVILNCIESSEDLDYQGIVSIESYYRDNHLFFEISDNGYGIDESIREKIFEPFFTTKDRGTGLGLTIAHKIIKEHNGDIFVVNDGGAKFIIKLPTYEL